MITGKQVEAARDAPEDRAALVRHAIKLMQQSPPWDGKTFNPELSYTLRFLAAAPSSAEQPAKTDRHARIGSTTFNPGVPVEVVIGRAYDEYDYHQKGVMQFGSQTGREQPCESSAVDVAPISESVGATPGAPEADEIRALINQSRSFLAAFTAFDPATDSIDRRNLAASLDVLELVTEALAQIAEAPGSAEQAAPLVSVCADAYDFIGALYGVSVPKAVRTPRGDVVNVGAIYKALGEALNATAPAAPGLDKRATFEAVIAEMRDEVDERRKSDESVGLFADHYTADLLQDWIGRLDQARAQSSAAPPVSFADKAAAVGEVTDFGKAALFSAAYELPPRTLLYAAPVSARNGEAVAWPGLSDLEYAIEQLHETGNYRDEEGEATDALEDLVTALKATPVSAPALVSGAWNYDMSAAPRDSTMLELLIRPATGDEGFNNLEDSTEPTFTIGFNSADHNELEWQFVGWNWQQDCFEDGHGTPVAWRYPRTEPQAAQDNAPADAREGGDTKRLDFIAREYLEVSPFGMPTPGGDDADVGWRIYEFHQAEPRKRLVAEHFRDDLRAVIDRAMGAGGGGHV